MSAEAIKVLVRFARVVSDADVDSARDVPALLADALREHVRPDGVAIFALDERGVFSLVAERNLGDLKGATSTAEPDDISQLGEYVLGACSKRFATQLSRPLVAGANLFGGVVLCYPNEAALPQAGSMALDLAEGLIDLAAIALENHAHIEQLERQFASLHEQQEMLIRSEKLRALGQMAAGISHDLKNILNPLSLHIQVIARGIDRGQLDDAKESAGEMKQVLQRGLQTLERLRDFSRQSTEPKSELVQIDQLVVEAMAIGKARAASSGGRLPRFDIAGLTAPSPVRAIGSELVSALVNLIVNAIDAMGGAKESTSGTGTIAFRSGEDDSGIWVEVRDSGPGMTPEVAKRIFEPFFTTKGQEGTGLGLAMVYATMQRHGGSVSVTTKPGEGTAFKLSLPADGPMSLRTG